MRSGGHACGRGRKRSVSLLWHLGLIGCELETPILTKESCDSGLSNEYGANGRINYLKNIIGLWLIQESRREYARQGEEYSFGELAKLADEAEAFHCFIDPDAQEFVAPGNIPERIQKFCRRTGQPVPETVGETVRCIYESLVLKYRYALEQLEGMTGKNFTILHILGGGANAGLLCQMTADACRLMVKSRPGGSDGSREYSYSVEGTACHT